MQRPRRLWFKLDGDIRILNIGKVCTTNRHPDRILPVWVLVIVNSGERTFRIYSEDYCIHGGEFFLLPPHVRHMGLLEDKHEACYFEFYMDGEEVSPPQKIDSESILLPLYGNTPVDLDCFGSMDYAVRHRAMPFYSEKFIIVQMQAVLYQLSLYMQKSVLWTRSETKLAYHILQFIQDNMNRKLRDRDYQEQFGKSYRQLNNIFFHCYSTTIKQMQVALRINRAKLMLSSGHTITETSQECGFEDYLYFLKAFKNKTGMSPKTFCKTVSIK